MTQIKKPNPMDVLHFITHDDLLMFKPKNSNVSIEKQVKYEQKKAQTQYKKGVVFVSPSKEALCEGKGHIITSYETLHQQYDVLTHWTPNTYWGGTYYNFKNRKIKGHTKDNLKQINVIGFDIDTKSIHPYEMFLACDQEELPRPNLILETPKGYQGFFILSNPFYISDKNSGNALTAAERLATNVLEALKKHLPIDKNCTPFGFFRMPNDENIVFFDDEIANTNSLLSWSKDYEKRNRKMKFKVFNGGSNASALDYTSSDWYFELINTTHIKSGHFAGSRNNTLFTLALAAYASEKSYEATYDELDQFNSNLEQKLSKTEFERVLKSAYSGKYSGPKREYVEGLLEMWTNGKVTFKGSKGWYKFKKDRDMRERSHYEEREEDILNYLNGRVCPENPFLTGSLANLAEEFGMAVSTLKEVLKRSKQLMKNVKGAGRGAVTMVTTKIMFFQSILRKHKERMTQAQLSYKEYLIVDEVIKSTFDLVDLDIEEWLENTYRYGVQGGPAPPGRRVV